MKIFRAIRASLKPPGLGYMHVLLVGGGDAEIQGRTEEGKSGNLCCATPVSSSCHDDLEVDDCGAHEVWFPAHPQRSEHRRSNAVRHRWDHDDSYHKSSRGRVVLEEYLTVSQLSLA
jgi:hypothetical protein